MLDLKELQKKLWEWRMKNFPQQKDNSVLEVESMMGVTEEVGELAHAILKSKQGIRGYDLHKKGEEGQDAVGDIIIYLTGVCDANGWCLETIIRNTTERVLKRDWQNDPEKAEAMDQPVDMPVLTETDIFNGLYKQTMKLALAIVEIRAKDYNTEIPIREYWQINGLMTLVQMIDFKVKRVGSIIKGFEYTRPDVQDHIKKGIGKVIESCVDIINYAGFLSAESVFFGNENSLYDINPDTEAFNEIVEELHKGRE